MKFFILVISIFISVSFVYAKPINSFDFYSDGIYDAYIQINKEIKAGIQERYMQEYVGKYLVAIDVENSSIVDIIYYKTIGSKKSLDAVTVLHVATGKHYLVFDYFKRKANAALLQDKLLEYKVPAVIMEDAEAEDFKRDPLVLKKFIDDLKEVTRRMPVKVIAVNRSISGLPPINRGEKYRKEKHAPRISGKKAAVSSFLQLKKKFAESGWLNQSKIHFCKKVYEIGDTIQGFKIVKIKGITGFRKIVLLGKDGKYYTLKETPHIYDKQVKKIIKEKRQIEEEAKKIKVFACDFSKVATIKDKDHHTKRTKETEYGNYIGRVKLLGEDDLERKLVRKSGGMPVYISKKHFDLYCKEEK